MKALIIEGNPFDAKLIANMLQSDPQFEVVKVEDLSSGLNWLARNSTDIILLDLNLPDSRSIETFAKVYDAFPDIPVVILTGQDDKHTVMEVMRLGAQDYLVKGKTNKHLLLRSLQYSVERNRSDVLLREKNYELESFNHKLEETIQTANQMAVEAEVAAMELNQIFNSTADAMWVLDNNLTITKINNAFLNYLGLPREKVLNRECKEVFKCSFCGGPDCLSQLINNPADRVEYELTAVKRNGTETSFILTATPFKTESGDVIGVIANYTDITNLKRAEALLKEKNKELERLSNIDGLTGIANRRKFDECLQSEWKRLTRDASPLSLILCDIDHFKLYNDHYGHQAGDDCLIAVADAIDKNLKRSTDLGARYGGEEFGIILPNTHGDGAFYLATVIRESIENLKLIHEHSSTNPCVTLSLGVTETIPTVDKGPEELVMKADKALYEAKEKGRNQAVFRSFHK